MKELEKVVKILFPYHNIISSYSFSPLQNQKGWKCSKRTLARVSGKTLLFKQRNHLVSSQKTQFPTSDSRFGAAHLQSLNL